MNRHLTHPTPDDLTSDPGYRLHSYTTGYRVGPYREERHRDNSSLLMTVGFSALGWVFGWLAHTERGYFVDSERPGLQNHGEEARDIADNENLRLEVEGLKRSVSGIEGRFDRFEDIYNRRFSEFKDDVKETITDRFVSFEKKIDANTEMIREFTANTRTLLEAQNNRLDDAISEIRGMRSEIRGIRSEVRGDLKDHRHELKDKIDKSRNHVLLVMSILSAATIAILGYLI